MIIQLAAPDVIQSQAAAQELTALIASWEPDALETPPPSAAIILSKDKTVDPIALASLMVSVPASVLAVADIVDRILKRRRAQQMIDQAAVLANRQVTLIVIHQDKHLPLAAMKPDDLLDIFAADSISTDPDQPHTAPPHP